MANTAAAHAWLSVIQVAFPGNKRIKTGRPKVITANSNATGAAPVGVLWYNSNNSKAWINKAVAGNWVDITAD